MVTDSRNATATDMQYAIESATESNTEAAKDESHRKSTDADYAVEDSISPGAGKDERNSLEPLLETSPIASPRHVDELLDFVQNLPDVESPHHEGSSIPRKAHNEFKNHNDFSTLLETEEDTSLNDAFLEPDKYHMQKVRAAVFRGIEEPS